MPEAHILQLLDRAGSPPQNPDFEHLQQFLERSQLEANEKDILREFLTQPALRLIWAQPPQAGYDCVQSIEVRLPPSLKGLHPRLHVCFPKTLQRLSGQEVSSSADKLLGTSTTADRQNWGLLDLQQYLAPEHVWRTDMQFRLPPNMLGTYLWKFRIDFVNGWGHAELHRLFEACYTVVIAREKTGQTTLTIDAGDFTNVTLPDLSLWDNVRIQATGNTNILNTSQRPDFSAMFGGAHHGTQPAKQGVVIDPTITRANGQISTVVTPHSFMQDPCDSNRRCWPAVRTAELQVSNNRAPGNSRIIRLHAAPTLNIGQRTTFTDKKSGKAYTNDIVTDFVEDDLHLSSEQREKRNKVISRRNSALTISADALTVRNTGSPGSDYPGYTEVSYRVGTNAIKVALTDRDEERPIEGVRDGQVKAVHLEIGGSPGDESGPIPGYPLQLIPVPLWQDNETNSWQSPEAYVELLGGLPTLCREATRHGMDSVLIKHEVSRTQPPPLHAMLLRQLWLGIDGLPIEDLRADRPRDAAAVRVLIASHEVARDQIFFMQPLQQQHTLLVQSARHQRPMRVQPRNLVALHTGDRLILQTGTGTRLWEATFSVISPELA